MLSPLFIGYLVAFGGAAVACVIGVGLATRLVDEEATRGLRWLLGLSACWAGAHVGYLFGPTPAISYGWYLIGIVVGFAAVGAWLYFCSAFTGRTLHRRRGVLLVGGATFLGVTVLKVTNPWHGWYFETTIAQSPFPHLGVIHGSIHWVVMGLAYALALVGMFMLYETFDAMSAELRPLYVVLGLAGAPVALDIIGATTGLVLDITHSPIGVAAFAIGVLIVYVDRFQAFELAGRSDDPVIVLDEDDRIRDLNAVARQRFPTIADGQGEPLGTVLPELARIDGPDRDGVTIGDRHYTVSSNPFSSDRGRLGSQLTLVDVTDREAYRRELERQNQRLESFASIVSHDLRNPLTVAAGRVDLARSTGERSHLDAVEDAHDRMLALIEDLLSLARAGATIGDREAVDLAAIAREAWSTVDTPAATLAIGEGVDDPVAADPDRVRQLFENLFRNAVEHGGPDVTVTVGPLADKAGFYVADDGPGIDPAVREDLFDHGVTSNSAGTGIGLAIVSELVEAHGWSITTADAEGARFEILTG